MIAWRLALMTLRDVPTMKPDCLFSDLELRFLGDYARRGPTLGAAVKLVAILGGYLDRKHAPGNQTMWLSATGRAGL